MKKILASSLAAIALATVAVPATSFADPPPWANDRGDRSDRGRDGDRDRNHNEGWNRDRDGRNDRHDRWDNRRDNGYYYNERFYRGAPPAAYYGRPGFRPGYRAWSRGDRLPPGYHYTVVDYRGRWSPPPRGYHYVRDDRGDILLAAIATGIIASVIANN